jgi:radical SAM protein with 4Fe4S-binding SPASM domain
VVDALEHMNQLLRAAHLARRPRIGVSWTLKANNVEELPAFVDRAIGIGIDQLTVRHLLIFHGKDRDQSIVDRPDLCNDSLRATYRLLEKHGVRSDCPPIIGDAPVRPQIRPGQPVPVAIGKKSRDGCMFVRRTAVVHADGVVPTCSAPFAASAGHFGSGISFADIWNGPVMQSVRATLDTPDEWKQCQHCWYREGRYESQRKSFDTTSERYEITDPDTFTRKAWDFEEYRQS